MNKIIISILALVFLSTNALSEENITQKDVNELNMQSNPNTVSDASDTIDDWAYEAIQKFGVDEFGEHNGKFFFFASQSVSLKPTDPQFGDALVNAYDKALMELQNKYLMARFGRTIVDKVKQFYSDRSTNAKEIDLPNPSAPNFTDKVLNIMDKSLDVTDKKLDKELAELGVNPDEVAKMTPKMKKDVFRDKFLKSTMRKASGSIAGLFPLQTSIAKDSTGKYVVGIIAIATQKTIQIAKDIKLQRQSIVQGKGKDVKSLLPQDDTKYLSTFGVRLSYDLDGTPMIVSYGIGSYSKDGDDYIDEQLKSEAKANAVSNADAQIAEIVNGYMNINENRKNGEEIKKYVERDITPNSDSIEKTIKNIIKITNNSAKSSASISLKGISTVKTWRKTTKEGVKFVGAVRVWKYKTLKAVKDFNNGKYKSKNTQKKATSYSKSLEVSEPVNDVNDF